MENAKFIASDISSLAEAIRESSANQKSTPVLANPAPLGLCAFALTTFVLSSFNARLYTFDKGSSFVSSSAYFYGGLTQLIAGYMEYNLANTFGTTAFCSYGAFWLSFGLMQEVIIPGLSSTLTADEIQKGVGIFLLGWAIFTTILFIASFRTTKALALLFLFLGVTFWFLTIGHLGLSPVVNQIGGCLGIVTAFIAWYTAAAQVINATWKVNVLPLGAGGWRLSFLTRHKDTIELV